MLSVLRYHYLDYRRLGYSRAAAFRYAWMVATAGRLA
jgi:hypothetical protein